MTIFEESDKKNCENSILFSCWELESVREHKLWSLCHSVRWGQNYHVLQFLPKSRIYKTFDRINIIIYYYYYTLKLGYNKLPGPDKCVRYKPEFVKIF